MESSAAWPRRTRNTWQLNTAPASDDTPLCTTHRMAVCIPPRAPRFDSGTEGLGKRARRRAADSFFGANPVWRPNSFASVVVSKLLSFQFFFSSFLSFLFSLEKPSGGGKRNAGSGGETYTATKARIDIWPEKDRLRFNDDSVKRRP